MGSKLGYPEGDVSIPVGFFQALQPFGRIGDTRAVPVSIPVGFFQALQPMTSIFPEGRNEFQSLSGFFRPCNPFQIYPHIFYIPGFNPCRVFSGLATRSDRRKFASRTSAFQSLSGFFRPCNPDCSVGSIPKCHVSIPVGFFQALQPGLWTRSPLFARSFQSLSGFFRPCNFACLKGRPGLTLFQSLSGFFRPCNRLVGPDFPGLQIHVSIPVGFFQALQPSCSCGAGKPVPWFQSLSGFFRPCNNQRSCRFVRWRCVSIPVGFFQALQRFFGISAFSIWSMFQSLSGFFRPCNGEEMSITPMHQTLFQSLSGFFRPCNWVRRHRRKAGLPCFNPCRVFSGLAT